MIRLTACLLLTTAALAHHYGPSGASSNVPMDFNDDIYNRDMRIQPSSNFFYNFEQERIDQPPQVEVREENLGKYMGRPRPTTPYPNPPKLNKEHVPDMNTVHLHHLAEPNTVSTMSPYVPLGPYNAHLPATMPPPPPTPRWMDLSDDTFKNHAHHKPSRYAVKSNTYQPPAPPTPAPVLPTQWSQPASMPASYDDNMYSQQQPVDMGYANQMPQYYSSTTDDVMGGDRYIREPAGTRSRGSHKFDWGDLALPTEAALPVTTMRAPAPPSAHNQLPSSFPTLTPWSGDSFGK